MSSNKITTRPLDCMRVPCAEGRGQHIHSVTTCLVQAPSRACTAAASVFSIMSCLIRHSVKIRLDHHRSSQNVCVLDCGGCVHVLHVECTK